MLGTFQGPSNQGKEDGYPYDGQDLEEASADTLAGPPS